MGGVDPATRAIRWVARLVVIGLFVREYVRLYWSVLHPGQPGAAPDLPSPASTSSPA
jgi:hypothetical protein